MILIPLSYRTPFIDHYQNKSEHISIDKELIAKIEGDLISFDRPVLSNNKTVLQKSAIMTVPHIARGFFIKHCGGRLNKNQMHINIYGYKIGLIRTIFSSTYANPMFLRMKYEGLVS